jgi:translation initiation factor 1A
MPKNLKGGNKHKKMKNKNTDELTSKDFILKEPGQDYAKVQKLLGNCRVELLCNDSEIRLGIIRGNMRKKRWLNNNSIVLYSIRDFEKGKVDIIHIYKDNVVKQMENKMNLTFSITTEDKNMDDIFMCVSEEEEIQNNIIIKNTDPDDDDKDDVDDKDDDKDDIFIDNKKNKNDLDKFIDEL